MNRVMGEHGLSHDIADRKDIRHVGAHLLVDRDKATLIDRNPCPIRRNQLAIGFAADGAQYLVEDVSLDAVGPLECQRFSVTTLKNK